MRRRLVLLLVLLVVLPLAAGVVPVGAVAGGTAIVHLRPDHLPSCLAAGAWYGGCAEFGEAVATDGEMVVVGAPSQPMTVGDTTFFTVGSAYVYAEGIAGWSGEEIQASDASGFDRFGSSVAADAGRFVVGAPGAAAGRAYLYEPTGGGWTETILDPDDTGNYDDLGYSLAFDGDRIVAGASGADVDDGVVYLFEDGPGGWVRTQRLTSGETTDEGYGFSVAVDGDRIVVGAPYYGDYNFDPDDPPESTGRVFVYTKNGATWDRETFLPPTEEAGQYYGFSVAVDGDTVFVGASGRGDDPGDKAGSVFAYTWTGTRWLEEEITPAEPRDFQRFGSSVAAGDGMLVVGANYNNQGYAQGAAYLFHKPRRTWVGEMLPEVAPLQSTRNLLGSSVAVDGDIVVSGAPETKFTPPGSTTYYGHGFAFLYRACGGVVATIVGTVGDDTLNGTLDSDVIVGLDGSDIINASRGHDLVCAGPGRDRIKAGAGKDTVYGEDGNDFLYGNAHYDRLYGGAGVDVLFGMAGNDTLDGGAGRDVASFPTAPGAVTGSLAAGTASGDGTDILVALEVLVGGAHDDNLIGDAGGNRLVGRDGDDTLAGGDGKDVLSGGRGNDTLDGEGGIDTLDGGPDRDTCTGETTVNCEP